MTLKAIARILCLAAAAASAISHPAVRLQTLSIVTEETADEVLKRLWELLEAADVVARGEDRIVARFSGTAGRFRYETVEVIDIDRGGIAFEHLRGPFRDCHERFSVRPSEGGGSIVTHEGTLTMRWGLVGWILSATVVRRAFEAHVEQHLVQAVVPAKGAETPWCR